MRKRSQISRLPKNLVADAATAVPVSADDDLFWEDKVADSMGLPRDRVRRLREQHLAMPEHYVMMQNAVVLTAAGIDRIRELTAPAPLPLAGENNDRTANSGPPAREKFMVVKIPANTRLLVCQRPAEKSAQIIVRVRTNEAFMVGMEVPVIAGHANTWQHYGRLPRRKGHW